MSKRRDTIVYAWNYLSWGGAQVYFLGLIEKAIEEFRIKVVLPAESDPQIVERFEQTGAEVIKFDPHFEHNDGSSKLSKHIDKGKSETAMLKAIEAASEPERTIVHAELAPWQCYSSLVWLLLRYPVFITMHNSAVTSNSLRRLIWKGKMRLVSRFDNFHPFTSNEDTKEFFRGYFSSDVSDRTVVTYTTANPEKIRLALEADLDVKGLKRKHGIPDDKKLVVAVGQFIDRKGRWEFLEASKLVSQKRDDTHFVWISNVPVDEESKARVEDYSRVGHFTFLRSHEVAKEHLDLFVFLRMADVFSLPSHTEGLPISILEAMGLGLPVVSTRINAIPEAIESGKNGILVEPRDSYELSEAILTLLDDESLREQYGKEAKKTVTDRFDETKVAEIAFREYLKVANG